MKTELPFHLLGNETTQKNISVSGTLSVTDYCLEITLEDGRKVAVELDTSGLRVHTWTEQDDAPVSTTLTPDNTVTLENRDFIDDGGIFSITRD